MADNKLAENAGWDEKLLGLELQYLSELDIDFDVSIGIPKDGKWLPEEIEAVRPHFEKQEAHDEEALRQRYRDEFASRKHYDRK